MADETLEAFVGDALKRGESHDSIRAALTEAGWAQEQIAEGLHCYAEVAFPVPVPRPRVYVSARDVFQYLLVYVMLYVFVYNLGSLWFGLIDLLTDDWLTTSYRSTRERITFATAALIVAYPVFLLLTARIHRQVRADATQRNSAVRRWLTYLTLFIAATVIVIDVIYLLYNFLSGGLTTRFVGKSLVVALLAALVFGFYFRMLKLDDRALQS